MVKKIALLCSCMFLAATAVCAAPYVSGNFGLVSVTDSDFSVAGFGNVGDISYDSGYALIGAIGTEFMPAIRGEVELAYRTNDVDTVNISGLGSFTGGDISALSVMANIFKDIPLNGSLTPFVGAGLGFANVELDDGTVSVDDTVFAFQLAAGAGYALSDALTFEVQYRFFGTSDPDFDGVESEYLTHNFLAGVRLNF